ncbi:MAG: hypothetical protein L0Z07_08000 [Planctomycetes bacterium]|nr:hypothetical protein [Planctomycetota bacterium]
MGLTRRPQLLMIAALFISGQHARTALAKEPWVDTRQVGPFVCQATFPLGEYEVLFAELPELQRELTRTLGLPPARRPIDIKLFADETEHRAFLKQHYAHVPYRRALFVKEGGNAGVYAYRHDELDIDLRHECTHALLHSVLSTVPLWLDEGLAEYFEVPPSQRAFDHPHFESLRWNMRLGMVQTLEDLEQRKELSEMAGFDYRYSWAWVHFMLHGPQSAHHALVGYIASLGQSAPGDAEKRDPEIRLANYSETSQEHMLPVLLSARLVQTVPNPTEKMVQHFKHWHQ